MMKKIIALTGASLLLVSVVLPVFAHGGRHRLNDLNVANVSQVTSSMANTSVDVGNVVVVEKAGVHGLVGNVGNNYAGKLSTGRATAKSAGLVVANTEVGCSMCSMGSTRNIANVDQATLSEADTGVVVGSVVSVRKAHVGLVGNLGNNSAEKLHTGNANAKSAGVVVVNTEMNWMSLWR